MLPVALLPAEIYKLTQQPASAQQTDIEPHVVVEQEFELILDIGEVIIITPFAQIYEVWMQSYMRAGIGNTYVERTAVGIQHTVDNLANLAALRLLVGPHVVGSRKHQRGLEFMQLVLMPVDCRDIFLRGFHSDYPENFLPQFPAHSAHSIPRYNIVCKDKGTQTVMLAVFRRSCQHAV